MSNISYEEPGMKTPEPHTMPDENQYHDYRNRDEAQDSDTAMDEHAPTIQDTLQSSDALIRGIVNNTAHSSDSNRKRSYRRGASHGTSASLGSANSATLIAPVSQTSDASSHNGHARHASASGIHGATHGTPIVDEISKLIFRLATEVSKMREQLRFVKAQYESAIEEISKAQDVINSLEEQNGRAVDETRREREKVRILEEKRKLKDAREAAYEGDRRPYMEEGFKGGRDAERERQKKAMREQVEDDEVYQPPWSSERRDESSEPREIYNRVGDESLELSPSRPFNANPTIAPVVTIDPQTHTFNVIGLPLFQTGNPTAATYPPPAPADLFRHTSAPIDNREQPNGGRGPPNHIAFFPRDNPNINFLSELEEKLVKLMSRNGPELSMEEPLEKWDNQTSALPRINSSNVDRDSDRSDPSQQRPQGGRIIGNGQGYRTPIRQRSGSGSTNSATGTGIKGVSRTTGRTSVTPPRFSTSDGSTLLDEYGILGDGGGYGGGLMSQVAELTPIMEARSEPGPSPTRAHLQDTAINGTLPQAEIDHGESEHQGKERKEEEERSRDEQERLQHQQQRPRWQAQQPSSEQHHVPLHRLTSQPSPTNHGTRSVSSGRFDASGQYVAAPTNTTVAKGKGKATSSAQVDRRSVRDQDPPMTTRSRVQSMYGISDHNAPKRTPAYESAPLPKKTPVYEDAPLPPQKSARMMPGGYPQNQSGGHTLGVEGRSAFGKNGGPMPSPSKSQSSSQIRRGMEEDLDTPIVPYDERDTGDQERFSTIDILDERAEHWGPKSGTFTERKLPRSHNQDVVEVIPHRPVHHQDASPLSTLNHPPPRVSFSVGVRGPGPADESDEAEDESVHGRAYAATSLPRERTLGSPSGDDSGPIIPGQHHRSASNPTRSSLPAAPLGSGFGDRIGSPPSASVGTSHFDKSSLGPIRSNEPSSFLVDQSGNPIRTPLRQSMPITASARSSMSAMPLPPVQPKDNPWATGRTTISQLPRPDAMHEPARPSPAMVRNTATAWAYLLSPGQSTATLGPLSNGRPAFYHRSPTTAAVVPNGHVGYLWQRPSPSGPLSHGSSLHHLAHPPTTVVPNSHFGYLGQNQSGRYTLNVEAHNAVVKREDRPSTQSMGPIRTQNPRPGNLYNSAPSSPVTGPNASTTWGYFRYPGQGLTPLGPLGNGGLAFSASRSATNQTAVYNITNTQNQMPPRSTRFNIPGTARSGVASPPAGSTRFNIMDVTPH